MKSGVLQSFAKHATMSTNPTEKIKSILKTVLVVSAKGTVAKEVHADNPTACRRTEPDRPSEARCADNHNIESGRSVDSKVIIRISIFAQSTPSVRMAPRLVPPLRPHHSASALRLHLLVPPLRLHPSCTTSPPLSSCTLPPAAAHCHQGYIGSTEIGFRKPHFRIRSPQTHRN
jgi:hypothetical protein